MSLTDCAASILDQVRHEVQDFRTFRRRLAAASWFMLLPLGDFAPACIRTENACWVKPISLPVRHRRACRDAHHLRNLGHAKTTHRSPQPQARHAACDRQPPLQRTRHRQSCRLPCLDDAVRQRRGPSRPQARNISMAGAARRPSRALELGHRRARRRPRQQALPLRAVGRRHHASGLSQARRPPADDRCRLPAGAIILRPHPARARHRPPPIIDPAHRRRRSRTSSVPTPACSISKARARRPWRSRTFRPSPQPAREHGGLVTAIDNTWSAGHYFKAFAAGCDVSIQSATKYIAGHSDVDARVGHLHASASGRNFKDDL